MDRYGNGEEMVFQKVFDSTSCTPSFRGFTQELFIGTYVNYVKYMGNHFSEVDCLYILISWFIKHFFLFIFQYQPQHHRWHHLNIPFINMTMSNNTFPLFEGMCVLAGCDFLPSVPGIGIKKAHSLVSKYKNLDRVSACSFILHDGKKIQAWNIYICKTVHIMSPKMSICKQLPLIPFINPCIIISSHHIGSGMFMSFISIWTD